jgi:hypothetical protein
VFKIQKSYKTKYLGNIWSLNRKFEFKNNEIIANSLGQLSHESQEKFLFLRVI